LLRLVRETTGWQLGPKENIQKNRSYGETDWEDGKNKLLLPSSIRDMSTCGWVYNNDYTAVEALKPENKHWSLWRFWLDA
jgi:hypothetical protein